MNAPIDSIDVAERMGLQIGVFSVLDRRFLVFVWRAGTSGITDGLSFLGQDYLPTSQIPRGKFGNKVRPIMMALAIMNYFLYLFIDVFIS